MDFDGRILMDSYVTQVVNQLSTQVQNKTKNEFYFYFLRAPIMVPIFCKVAP